MDETIEQLEEASRAATAAYKNALDEKIRAGSALVKAKLVATGLLGHMIEGPRWSGSAKTHRILVQGFGWTEAILSGPIIKKDGTPGAMMGVVAIEHATDLGLHVKPVEA